jgi:hypothetical protein
VPRELTLVQSLSVATGMAGPCACKPAGLRRVLAPRKGPSRHGGTRSKRASSRTVPRPGTRGVMSASHAGCHRVPQLMPPKRHDGHSCVPLEMAGRATELTHDGHVWPHVGNVRVIAEIDLDRIDIDANPGTQAPQQRRKTDLGAGDAPGREDRCRHQRLPVKRIANPSSSLEASPESTAGPRPKPGT